MLWKILCMVAQNTLVSNSPQSRKSPNIHLQLHISIFSHPPAVNDSRSYKGMDELPQATTVLNKGNHTQEHLIHNHSDQSSRIDGKNTIIVVSVFVGKEIHRNFPV